MRIDLIAELRRRLEQHGIRGFPSPAVALVVGIAANAAVVLLLWLLTDSGRPERLASAPPPAEPAAVVRHDAKGEEPLPGETFKPPAVADQAEGKAAVAVPARPKLIVRAARGDCWLEIRADSPSGKLLFFGTLTRGKSIPFRRTRLWLAFGAGSNLDVIVNGRRVDNFPNGTATATLTTQGLLARAT